MITCKELFETDFSHTFTLNQKNEFELTPIPRKEGDESTHISVEFRLILDFIAGVKYLALYMSELEDVTKLLPIIKTVLNDMLNPQGGIINLVSFSNKFTIEVKAPPPSFELKIHEEGSPPLEGFDLPFSGRIILYTEFDLPTSVQETLTTTLDSLGVHMHYRGGSYTKSQGEFAKAFISHDSRDKDEIARKIASGLRNRRQNVWYDEYSLIPGDSLRESIESGLKNSEYCILILTPNFLSKGGWVKREYDSIFTREIVEDKRVIIPVWHNVTVKDVYKYSPILADIVGTNWSKGEDVVCDELLRALAR